MPRLADLQDPTIDPKTGKHYAGVGLMGTFGSARQPNQPPREPLTTRLVNRRRLAQLADQLSEETGPAGETYDIPPRGRVRDAIRDNPDWDQWDLRRFMGLPE